MYSAHGGLAVSNVCLSASSLFIFCSPSCDDKFPINLAWPTTPRKISQHHHSCCVRWRVRPASCCVASPPGTRLVTTRLSSPATTLISCSRLSSTSASTTCSGLPSREAPREADVVERWHRVHSGTRGVGRTHARAWNPFPASFYFRGEFR